MINMAVMPLYMWEMWDVTPVTHERTDTRTVESSAVFSLSWICNKSFFCPVEGFVLLSLFVCLLNKQTHLLSGGSFCPPFICLRPCGDLIFLPFISLRNSLMIQQIIFVNYNDHWYKTISKYFSTTFKDDDNLWSGWWFTTGRGRNTNNLWTKWASQ